MHGVRETTQKLNTKIIESFYGTEEEPGVSISDLATRYGRSESTINKLLREYKLKTGVDRIRYNPPRDPRPNTEKKAMSLLHAYIGLTVRRFMDEHEMTQTGFGMAGKNCMSRSQVNDILHGARDLTISEINKLAETMGVTYEQLVILPKDFSLRPQVTYEQPTQRRSA